MFCVILVPGLSLSPPSSLFRSFFLPSLFSLSPDGNGTVSLEEFTRYLAAVSVLEHQQEERALAEAQQQLGSSIMD